MKQSKKIQPAGARRLKVYTRYAERVGSGRAERLPEIRLCGKWLRELGFGCGQSIYVAHEGKSIVITPEPD